MHKRHLIFFGLSITLIMGYQLFADNVGLVVNPGFEIQGNGKVKGWISWNWAPDKQMPDAKMSCETGKGRNSSNALRIEVNKEKHVGVWSNTPSRINAVSGEKYLLNVWVFPEAEKVIDFKVSAGFSNLKFESGKINKISKIFRILPNCGWQLISLPVEIPQEYNYVRIDLTLRTPGIIFIDDISFELQNKISSVSGIPYLLCGRAEKAPVIDGNLDDKCWQASIECSNFLLTQNKGFPKENSSALVTYDDKKIYFAFKFEEKYLDPVLNQLERFKAACKAKDGEVWTDDSVEIFIEPQNGKKYHIIINSLGTVYDAILGDSNGLSWDSKIMASSAIGNGFWILEAALPLSSIGVESIKPGDSCRMNLCRTRQPVPEFSSWSPVPLGFKDNNYWGYVEFANKVPGIKFGNLKYKNNNSIECNVEVSSPAKVDLYTNINIDNEYQWNTINTIKETLKTESSLPETLNAAICRFADIEYSLVMDNRVMYKSPDFRFKIGKSSYIIASRMGKRISCDAADFKTMNEICIPEGQAEEIVLLLSSSMFNELPDKVYFTLDMPLCCSLISPMHHRDSVSPFEIRESVITRENIPYRHYVMKFYKDTVTESDGPEWDILPIYFLVKMSGAEANINSGKIYFYSSIPEKKYSEIEQVLKINPLPPFSLKKAPRKLPFIFWPWSPFYSITHYGQKEQEKIFSKLQDAGFNIVCTELSLNTADYRKILHDKYNFDLAKMMPALTASISPGEREYLAKHTDEKEITLAGKEVDIVCFADMLEGKSAFAEEFGKLISNMAKVYQVLHIDYEFGIFGNNSPGYSKRNIEMFRRENGISGKEELDTKSLLGKHREPWVDFRCRQNGEMFKFYRDAIKNTNPDCIFGAYSAYQREGNKRENYGNDWRYLSKYVDLVMCGYERGDYKATRDAIGDNKLFNGGEGVWAKDYNSKQAETRFFRRLTDCGSFMLFCDGVDDGNVYRAVSRSIGVASDFEDFFVPIPRQDNTLINILNNKDVPSDPISVLINGKGERLIFIFNETDAEKMFVISNKNLPQNFKAVDYFDKKVIEGATQISCTVPPWRVKIIYFCQDTDNNPVVPKTLMPDSKSTSSSGKPVFVWSDKGRTNSYCLECRKKGEVESAKKIDGIKDNYSYSALSLTPGIYEWRVCSENVFSKIRSPWTNWTEFTVPAILNADVLPDVVAQGENIIFTADFPTGGDWNIDIVDRIGNKAGSYSGKGNKIEFAFDGKADKGALKEGAYRAMFYGNGIFNAEVPFSIDNKMSRRNLSVENLGIWIPMHWEGWETLEDKLYLAKDYDVTRSNSYSLRIIKTEHEYPFWSNYHRLAPSGTRMPRVKAGEKYKFSAWVKNSGMNVKSNIVISYYDENKRSIPGSSARLSGEQDWTLVSVISVVPPGAVRLALGLNSSGASGTSWFDCFKLEKIK